jgi:Tfp pilus assembly protein PilF
MKRTMRRWLPITVALAVLVTGCSHHADMTRPSTQDNFGVQMAKMSLWREALFRFRRAVEINPSDPMAHNNLAVAYEANGDFDSARKEYLEALKLDRSNQYIQKNYSRYVEFLSRNKKRQQKDVKTALAAPPTTPPAGAKATDVTGGPPASTAAEPAKPSAPTSVPAPTDLPPQPANPPPHVPPGGAR